MAAHPRLRSPGVNPVTALERIAYLLEGGLAPPYRVRAFRTAIATLRDLDPVEVAERARLGRLQELPGIGRTTEAVILDALAGREPAYLARLEAERSAASGAGSKPEGATLDDADAAVVEAAAALRRALRGDCHTHSDWSDGGSPIAEMAVAARDLGHEYLVLTDHSPRLKVANGLSAERLRDQLAVVAELNEDLAPFRILTGIEVDILDDGSLDQEEELLAQLDLVVASVHSKLRMAAGPMTARMVAAVRNPRVDILGHCTGRMLRPRTPGGRDSRPESTFDAEAVFAACAEAGTAVEINCRPERRDPPRRLLAQVVAAGCQVAIDTDAHAPGQLEWQPEGCLRAARCGVEASRVVNTMAADDLLAWAAGH